MKIFILGLSALFFALNSNASLQVTGSIRARAVSVEGNITKYDSVGLMFHTGSWEDGQYYTYGIKSWRNGSNKLCQNLGHTRSTAHEIAHSNYTCKLSKIEYFSEGYCKRSDSSKRVYGSLTCID